MLHCWDCIGQVMSSAWFSPYIPLRIKAKKFYLGLIRPENLICHHLGVLQVFFSKLHAGFHVSCTEERLPSGHSAIKPRLVEGCSDGWLSTTFSHLPNASLELSHRDLWVLLYLSHQGSFPPIAQFGRTASSRKGSGRPKRLPFKDYGGHCALSSSSSPLLSFSHKYHKPSTCPYITYIYDKGVDRTGRQGIEENYSITWGRRGEKKITPRLCSLGSTVWEQEKNTSAKAHKP